MPYRMCGPAPPCRKKTQIVRTSSGCRNCRLRRKKCDESRLACRACTRLGRLCDGYKTKLEFRNVSFRPTVPRDDGARADQRPIQLQAETTGSSVSRSNPDETRAHSNLSHLEAGDNDGEISSTPTTQSCNGQDVLWTDWFFGSRQIMHTALPTLNPALKPSKGLFYMSVWESQCTPALHPIFSRLARPQSLAPVLADTMMALAARQLSRMLPRAREFCLVDAHGSPFRPDLEQQRIGGEFSGSAMRCVARWTQEDFERDVTSALVRHRLNEWRARIPSSDLPVDSNSTTHDNRVDAQIQPLRFGTHNAAMNFAYYVVARIMQCGEFLGIFRQSYGRAEELNDACDTA
ncbi:hypothetical protein GGS23DRAFT_158645 [Durotheca rogersii]|uniref:uncharacterized protein n=1 Tax=Durotheca rogersii TaxID=419775 RepID=UPI00221E3C4A|nr:uncharacterized protein GGS23DRAFT_158645 [Durotheca rogersii]KAI5861223.1 hypothetical protein GGS23DRAFT_158645 [Durotheca rogersii]